VAEAPESGIVGVAAWEPADTGDAPAGSRALLLQGIYVIPARQGAGIGTRLVDAAVAAAREQRLDGLLVKAQAGADGFFHSLGFAQLPVVNPERDYPHRFWKPVVASGRHGA
jgi:GNAT superfamily N-acetyltransferase